VQFTASVELRDKLERLTALMRSEMPVGDLAAVIERAVTEKLERLEAQRFGNSKAPRKALTKRVNRSASRHIPVAVRRAVCARDANRCRFVDEEGRRCSERNRLEFHHRHPYAMGGDHSPGNVSLLCAAHNRLMAEHDYGRAAILRNLPSAEVHRRAPGTA
jgi:5-methylcytosine-specific restriction endonuclease McrA